MKDAEFHAWMMRYRKQWNSRLPQRDDLHLSSHYSVSHERRSEHRREAARRQAEDRRAMAITLPDGRKVRLGDWKSGPIG